VMQVSHGNGMEKKSPRREKLMYVTVRMIYQIHVY